MAHDLDEEAFVTANLGRLGQAYIPPGTPRPQPNGQAGRAYISLSVAEILAMPPREHIIENLVGENDFFAIIGDRKSGKSFLCMHLLYAVAQGREVFGRHVQQRPVLYVAAEGEGGIPGRIKALVAKFGACEHFRVLLVRPNFLDDEDVDRVIAEALRCGSRVVAIDTLARVTPGANENEAQTMGKFIDNCGRVKTAINGAVGVVHHGNKASKGLDPRGHSSMPAALDTGIQTERMDDGLRMARVAFAKDDADGDEFGFRLAVVEVGRNRRGEVVNSCIVEAIETTQKDKDAAKAKGLHRMAKGALEALQNLLAGPLRKPLPNVGAFPPHHHGVKVDEWQAEFITRGISKAERSAGQNREFRGAKSDLIAAKLVAERDCWAWLVHDNDMDGS